MVPQISESTMIAEVVARLTRRYAELPPEEISTAVHDTRTRFEQSRIRDFVPLLVERRAAAPAQPVSLVKLVPRETDPC